MQEATEVDKYGAQVTARTDLGKDELCLMVANVGRNGAPVGCAFVRGHRSLHSWSGIPGAASSKPPGPKGADREASARMQGGAKGRYTTPDSVCGAIGTEGDSEPLVCGYPPKHRGKHSWQG